MNNKDHISSARHIIDIIMSEYFDHPDQPDEDFNLDQKLLELLLYRVLDHLNAATA